MQTSKLVGIVVLAAVSVILIGSVLMPVITDYDDDVKVVKNNTTSRLAALIGEDDHVITYTASTKALTIDGNDVTPTINRGVLYTDLFNILYQTIETNPLEFYNSDTKSRVVVTNDFTATVEGKNVNIKYGTYEHDFECSWLYMMDDNGTYGMFNLYNVNTTIYVNSINDLYGSNVLVTTSDWFSYVGDKVSLVSGTETTATVTTTEVTGTKDIVAINVGGNGTGYAFEVDNSGTPYTVHPWIVIAPIEVTGYSETNNAVVPLLYALPVLLIVAIIVGVLALVYRSRMY